MDAPVEMLSNVLCRHLGGELVECRLLGGLERPLYLGQPLLSPSAVLLIERGDLVLCKRCMLPRFPT